MRPVETSSFRRVLQIQGVNSLAKHMVTPKELLHLLVPAFQQCQNLSVCPGVHIDASDT
jgi:hypothetical protein